MKDDLSTDPQGLAAQLTLRFEALFGGMEASGGPPPDESSAEFVARLASEWELADQADPATAGLAGGHPVAPLAAALQDAISSQAFLDRLLSQGLTRAPAAYLEAAIEAWRQSSAAEALDARVVPLRREGPKGGLPASAPVADSFLLLAAADGEREAAVVCRSQSGLWTLEIFVEDCAPDGRPETGYLLLSVHPDHRATYEGRNARVFVVVDRSERVLVDSPVKGGEVYAPIALRGLDLWTRDAVNVVFSSDRDRT